MKLSTTLDIPLKYPATTDPALVFVGRRSAGRGHTETLLTEHRQAGRMNNAAASRVIRG